MSDPDNVIELKRESAAKPITRNDMAKDIRGAIVAMQRMRENAGTKVRTAELDAEAQTLAMNLSQFFTAYGMELCRRWFLAIQMEPIVAAIEGIARAVVSEGNKPAQQEAPKS